MKQKPKPNLIKYAESFGIAAALNAYPALQAVGDRQITTTQIVTIIIGAILAGLYACGRLRSKPFNSDSYEPPGNGTA